MALDDWFGVRSYRPFTTTIAAPGVISSNAHGLVEAEKVILATTGALPTGLAIDTWYYVIEGTYSDGTTDPDTFKLASSKANAEAGTAITTSGSQSGQHFYAPAKKKGLTVTTDDDR